MAGGQPVSRHEPVQVNRANRPELAISKFERFASENFHHGQVIPKWPLDLDRHQVWLAPFPALANQTNLRLVNAGAIRPHEYYRYLNDGIPI